MRQHTIKTSGGGPEQHMDEEELELFPQATRLLAAEMEEITAAMQEMQESILVS